MKFAPRYFQPWIVQYCILTLCSIWMTLGGTLSSAPFSKSRAQAEIHMIKELGIPLIYQKAEGSEIFQFSVGFDTGYARVNPELKRAGSVLMGTMTMATEDYSKEQLFELREKMSIGLQCVWTLTNSFCGVNTINENWKDGLKILASSILRPSLTDRDMTLVRDRTVASLKSEMSSPASLANDEINKIFYGSGHPYFVTAPDELKYLAALKRSDLVGMHAELLKSAKVVFTVVTSMKKDEVLAAIVSEFPQFAGRKNDPTKVAKRQVPVPDTKVGTKSVLKSLEIPSAYISIKFNSIDQYDPRLPAATLMYEIMAKELFEEIRTKRSLSYHVNGRLLAVDIGVGVLTASTSKPQETLLALETYLKEFRSRDWSKFDIEQYKMGFTTQYFLLQEGHEELASTLLSSYLDYGSLDRFNQFTKNIGSVRAKEIAEIAKLSLKNFKISMVFDEKKSKAEWLDHFVKSF